MTNKRIFITGGASGLGRALAERYANEGWAVCIGDIHDERLEETQKILSAKARKSHALRCDVRRIEDLEAVAEWLTANWGGIDLVVNNAGVSAGGWFEDVPLKDWEWILDINLLGVVRGCQVFSKVFQKQGGGRFINVASAAGLMHMPRMASYNASKAAVVALSETLRFELSRHNIKVSVVCPTFFRTNLAENVRAPDEETRRASRRLVENAKISAETIADEIYRAVLKDTFIILPDSDARRGFSVKRLLPFSVYTSLMNLKFRQSWLRATRA